MEKLVASLATKVKWTKWVDKICLAPAIASPIIVCPPDLSTVLSTRKNMESDTMLKKETRKLSDTDFAAFCKFTGKMKYRTEMLIKDYLFYFPIENGSKRHTLPTVREMAKECHLGKSTVNNAINKILAENDLWLEKTTDSKGRTIIQTVFDADTADAWASQCPEFYY